MPLNPAATSAVEQ